MLHLALMSYAWRHVMKWHKLLSRQCRAGDKLISFPRSWSKLESRGFETSRHLVVIRLTAEWIEALQDSKVHGVNMGPTWVLSAPDWPHVGPINLAIRAGYHCVYSCPNSAGRQAEWQIQSLTLFPYWFPLQLMIWHAFLLIYSTRPMWSPGTSHVNP